MRMGFNWSVATRKSLVPRLAEKDESTDKSLVGFIRAATCSTCDKPQRDKEGNIIITTSNDKRASCKHCGNPLWTLRRSNKKTMSQREILNKALCQIPTIGKKTAEKLLKQFGEKLIKGMLDDNIYQFVNLMDENGDLFFSDRQSTRMERSLAKTEFGFSQGGYQPTEFIKRYLPNKFFDMLIVDEGHEYKNGDSAQGQAMGVLASKVSKTLLLTGTLMGGYASDLFFLLWRINPSKMIECGFSADTSMGAASMSFMREHGVLKDIFKETEGNSYKTSRGKKTTVRTSKAPGFGPKGIVDHVLPITAFLKLKDIGQNVLPSYTEEIINIPMTKEQSETYGKMSDTLGTAMRKCLSQGDNSLLGVVMNVLLRWPDTGFKTEMVLHPRTRDTILFERAIFDDLTLSPKEKAVIKYIKAEKEAGRRVLVYTTYTGKRDIAARLKRLFEEEHLKTAVLRSSVGTDKREDWIIDQVDRNIDVMVCNPELVKTGLDLLDFPTIIFMQTGYNVYTVQQASRRSWRIGQTLDVKVVFFGYEDTAQTTCMRLMGKKIAVSQSTSGDIPDNGLDSLNTEEQSIEMELARALIKK
jgi:SNF2 family DNA or RNA helicase